jgi:hypothetical protein
MTRALEAWGKALGQFGEAVAGHPEVLRWEILAAPHELWPGRYAEDWATNPDTAPPTIEIKGSTCSHSKRTVVSVDAVLDALPPIVEIVVHRIASDLMEVKASE